LLWEVFFLYLYLLWVSVKSDKNIEDVTTMKMMKVGKHLVMKYIYITTKKVEDDE